MTTPWPSRSNAPPSRRCPWPSSVRWPSLACPPPRRATRAARWRGRSSWVWTPTIWRSPTPLSPMAVSSPRPDDLHRRDVTVIAANVVEQLFQHEDPVGKTIVVDGHAFEVIGTLNKFKGVPGRQSRRPRHLYSLLDLQETLSCGERSFHQRPGFPRTDGRGAGRNPWPPAPPPSRETQRAGQLRDIDGRVPHRPSFARSSAPWGW